jgi:hypothetical protein
MNNPTDNDRVRVVEGFDENRDDGLKAGDEGRVTGVIVEDGVGICQVLFDLTGPAIIHDRWLEVIR